MSSEILKVLVETGRSESKKRKKATKKRPQKRIGSDGTAMVLRCRSLEEELKEVGYTEVTADGIAALDAALKGKLQEFLVRAVMNAEFTGSIESDTVLNSEDALALITQVDYLGVDAMKSLGFDQEEQK